MLRTCGNDPGISRFQPHGLPFDLQFSPSCNYKPNHLLFMSVLGFVLHGLLVAPEPHRNSLA
jgi:hypothetical protein